MTETCPFCGAPFEPYLEEETSGHACARCGEMLPAASRQGAGYPEAGAAQLDRFQTPARWSNRRIAGLVLILMALIAAGGLALALRTQSVRRARDYAPSVRTVAATTGRFIPPAQLAALRYLPAEIDGIAGLDVARALQDPIATDLMALARTRGQILGLDQLEQTTGLALADFDHVVMGVRLRQRMLAVTVVAVTRRPVDLDNLRNVVRRESPVEVALQTPNPHTIVLTYPSRVATESRPQPGPLLEFGVPGTLLRDHVKSDAWLWLVAQIPKDGPGAAEAVLPTLLPEAWKALVGVQAAALWIVPGDQVEANGFLQCKSAAAAGDLASVLIHLLSSETGWVKRVQGDAVTVQMRMPVTAALTFFQRSKENHAH